MLRTVVGNLNLIRYIIKNISTGVIQNSETVSFKASILMSSANVRYTSTTNRTLLTSHFIVLIERLQSSNITPFTSNYLLLIFFTLQIVKIALQLHLMQILTTNAKIYNIKKCDWQCKVCKYFNKT